MIHWPKARLRRFRSECVLLRLLPGSFRVLTVPFHVQPVPLGQHREVAECAQKEGKCQQEEDDAKRMHMRCACSHKEVKI